MKYFYHPMPFAGFLFVLCFLSSAFVQAQTQELQNIPAEAYDIPYIGDMLTREALPYADDQLIVIFKDEAVKAKTFMVQKDAAGEFKTGLLSFDKLNRKHGVDKVVKLLSEKGKHPEMEEQLGLNRWHVLKTDGNEDIKELVEIYKADPNVEMVMPDYKMYPTDHDAEYYYAYNNWARKNTGMCYTALHDDYLSYYGIVDFDCFAEKAWEYSQGHGSSNVVIAVIDTGVELDHPDLVDAIWTNPDEIAGNYVDDDRNGIVDDIHGADFGSLPSGNDPSPISSDGCEHGTECAGVIAANSDSGATGIASGCKIMPIKVTDNFDNILSSSIQKAIRYATDQGAQIISMSFGKYTDQMTSAELNYYELFLLYAWNNGVIMFAASGNGEGNNDIAYTTKIDFPACSGAVYAVGAVGGSGNRPVYSDYKSSASQDDIDSIDFAGPVRLSTTTVGGGYQLFFDGTSCACPYVAGVAGLILSQHPTWTRDQVIQRMKDTATDIINSESGEGWDVYTGYGLVNAAAAVCNSTDYVLPCQHYYGSSTITAGNTILTHYNAVIESGATVTFEAGSSISLEPGFTAQEGCTFTAKLP